MKLKSVYALAALISAASIYDLQMQKSEARPQKQARPQGIVITQDYHHPCIATSPADQNCIESQMKAIGRAVEDGARDHDVQIVEYRDGSPAFQRQDAAVQRAARASGRNVGILMVSVSDASFLRETGKAILMFSHSANPKNPAARANVVDAAHNEDEAYISGMIQSLADRVPSR